MFLDLSFLIDPGGECLIWCLDAGIPACRFNLKMKLYICELLSAGTNGLGRVEKKESIQKHWWIC